MRRSGKQRRVEVVGCDASPARTGTWARGLLMWSGAAAVVVWAWAPGLDAPYTYDDWRTPVADPASRSIEAWRATLPHTLRPLTKLTYAVESSLGLVEAPERRVVSLGLFLVAAALVAALARTRGLSSTGAAALAAGWACHPVHAETVIALAGRSTLLGLALSLLAALLLVRRRPGWAVLAAALAVLARETAWPWLVAVAGLATLEARRRLGPAIAAAAGAAALGAVLVLGSRRMRELLVFSFSDPFAADQLGLQWAALTRGALMLLIEPSGFAVDIDFRAHGFERAALVLAAAAGYVGAAFLAVRAAGPTRVAALLWMCLAAPSHGVVPKLDPLTARSISAMSVGLMMLAAGPLAAARRHRAALGLAALALIGAEVSMTRERAALYRDPLDLWQDAAERSTQATRPLVNLGTLLAQAGRLDEARAALAEAARRDPGDADVVRRLEAVDVLIEARTLLDGETKK